MLGTRGVVAIMAGITMTVAIVVFRSGRKPMGLWLLSAGFFMASIWSALSIFWTQENTGALPSESHLLLGTTAVAGTIYYWMLAKEATSEQ
ncbi:hypothetical protein SAMN05421858_1174 [Haladaptatus litoreus]|uniref:Uncharacterized protein n=1 Tax=Haladaptatus litoreus TaxID=553468 RepID=A0A1N6XKT0_9EURY|nr:hypothetical protein [Haladaptatus litoreus]SIR02955.1 hypothetical protein SAMN05421858_1174 [Haladaptatus litoreus]